MDGFTYREVGATRDPGALPPPGYHLVRCRVRLGAGPEVLAAAGQAVLDWRMHRGAGLAVDADTPGAAPGVRVVIGIGLGAGRWRLRAPCEVVWTVRDEHRTGFAYGTLAGHPECGEESFVVEQDPDSSVWLSVIAFSRAGSWYMRAAGPLGRLSQGAMARWYGHSLRRLTQKIIPKNGS